MYKHYWRDRETETERGKKTETQKETENRGTF